MTSQNLGMSTIMEAESKQHGWRNVPQRPVMLLL